MLPHHADGALAVSSWATSNRPKPIRARMAGKVGPCLPAVPVSASPLSSPSSPAACSCELLLSKDGGGGGPFSSARDAAGSVRSHPARDAAGTGTLCRRQLPGLATLSPSARTTVCGNAPRCRFRSPGHLPPLDPRLTLLKGGSRAATGTKALPPAPSFRHAFTRCVLRARPAAHRDVPASMRAGHMPSNDFYQSIRSTSTPSDVRNLDAGAGQPPCCRVTRLP